MDFPRVVRFPVPLDKGNEGSGDEIAVRADSEAWNGVSMMAPVKKFGRARLDTDFRGNGIQWFPHILIRWIFKPKFIF